VTFDDIELVVLVVMPDQVQLKTKFDSTMSDMNVHIIEHLIEVILGSAVAAVDDCSLSDSTLIWIWLLFGFYLEFWNPEQCCWAYSISPTRPEFRLIHPSSLSERKEGRH